MPIQPLRKPSSCTMPSSCSPSRDPEPVPPRSIPNQDHPRRATNPSTITAASKPTLPPQSKGLGFRADCHLQRNDASGHVLPLLQTLLGVGIAPLAVQERPILRATLGGDVLGRGHQHGGGGDRRPFHGLRHGSGKPCAPLPALGPASLPAVW